MGLTNVVKVNPTPLATSCWTEHCIVNKVVEAGQTNKKKTKKKNL
jgi:hypothetical protein